MSEPSNNPVYNVIAGVNVTDVVNVTNNTCNGSTCTDAAYHQNPMEHFEQVLRILVPIIFGLIAVLGFVGNMLVIVVVVSNRQMRNTTNLLIINLAVADLFFIIICVPFTAMGYAYPVWLFGAAWCKIYQYVINVTAYASVYTLVLMSFDRYLAVVHPITSMGLRTVRNAGMVVLVSWALIFALNVPILFQYTPIEYDYLGENRSACLNRDIMADIHNGRIFYGCFFAFAYVLPLTTTCVLYGFMLHRLLYGVAPGKSPSAESMRSKRRVTRMVVIVVAIFAICWLPIQIIQIILYFGTYPDTTTFVAIQIASNCLAYMNSCVNPILYAFLSENFRKSFRKLLCCHGKFQPVKLEIERTNVRAAEPFTRTTALNNNENCV